MKLGKGVNEFFFSVIVCFTPMLFPGMLNGKQGNSMYPFSSPWYDLTWYLTETHHV